MAITHRCFFFEQTHHGERVAVVEQPVGGHGLHGGLVLHLPLFPLLFELLTVGVGAGCIVDKCEFQQSAEDERQAHARPHVDGLLISRHTRSLSPHS